MKTNALVTAAVILTAFLSACGNGGRNILPPDHGLTLDPAASPQRQAALAVDSLEPEEIAETLVAWMTGASHTHYPFAGRFTRSVTARYTGSGRDSLATRFALAIDSVTATLPLPLRAHVLTVAAPPRTLAVSLTGDPDSTALVGAIKEAYGTDSLAAATFMNALSH